MTARDSELLGLNVISDRLKSALYSQQQQPAWDPSSWSRPAKRNLRVPYIHIDYALRSPPELAFRDASLSESIPVIGINAASLFQTLTLMQTPPSLLS